MDKIFNHTGNKIFPLNKSRVSFKMVVMFFLLFTCFRYKRKKLCTPQITDQSKKTGRGPSKADSIHQGTSPSVFFKSGFMSANAEVKVPLSLMKQS